MAATVDQPKCTACGDCVSTCPVDAISQQADNGNKAIIDADTCADCGACVDTCAAGAIAM